MCYVVHKHDLTNVSMSYDILNYLCVCIDRTDVRLSVTKDTKGQNTVIEKRDKSTELLTIF